MLESTCTIKSETMGTSGCGSGVTLSDEAYPYGSCG